MVRLIGVLLLAAGSLCAQTVYQRTITDDFGVQFPEQPIELPRTGAALSASAHRMIGPDGVEVPWQSLSNGAVLVRSNLPASRQIRTYRVTVDAAADTITIPYPNTQNLYLENGEPVVFTPSAPTGLTANVVYYLKNRNGTVYQLSTQADLSDTVLFTGGGFNIQIVRPGVVITGNTLYALAHGYQTGNAVQVTTNGTLPTGLATGTTYYVIRDSANTFRLATTRANALADTAISLSGGSGQHGTLIRWTWTLEVGAPTVTPAQPVAIATVGNNHEVTNGLAGVRVVTTAGNGSPFHLAAIQGVRLSDGTWTAGGPNRLYNAGTTTLSTMQTGYTATVTESGPLMVRIEAVHTLTRPEASYGSGTFLSATDATNNTVSIVGAGLGFMANGRSSFRVTADAGGTVPCGIDSNALYWGVNGTFDATTNTYTTQLSATKEGAPIDITCAHSGNVRLREVQALAGAAELRETITLYAGQKSIGVVSDFGAPLQYFINLRSTGVFEPTTARWRGHVASSQGCGLSNPGSPTNYVAYTDAFYTLPSIGDPFTSCVNAGAGSVSYIKQAPNWNLGSSGVDSGYYWLLYNSSATGSTPLAGYIIGRASQALASFNCGPGVYTGTNHHAAGGAAQGISMYAYFRGPDGASAGGRVRREWGIYTAPVSELADPLLVQPVAIEKNQLWSINLSRIAAYELEYGDPPGGWPAPFTTNALYDALVVRAQTDSAWRTTFRAANVDLAEVVDLWVDPTPAQAEWIVSSIEQYVGAWVALLNTRDSVHNFQWYGYSGYLNYQTYFTRAYAVLRSPAATAAQKARVKAMMAFVASMIWDSIYAPLDIDTGEGLGNPNQVLQFVAYRAQHALSLGVGNVHSQMSDAGRQTIARQTAENALAYIQDGADGGAPRGSTQYHVAAMDPAIANFLLLRNQGTSLSPYAAKWAAYGQWMMDALTPPEPRFGNIRKMVSSGDGNTAAIATPGMVATLLRGVDDTASNRLQWAWATQNSATTKTLGTFTAPAGLVIDQDVAGTSATLTSRHYRGYWSVLRHGSGTANETAAWFTNGNWYVDHRQSDPGQISIYAHSAPLAIDWNANLYNPQTSGSWMHNTALFTSDLGNVRWNQDSSALSTGATTWREANTQFAGLPSASLAETQFVGQQGATGSTWTRGITMVALDPAHPLIVVRDRFSSGAGKTVTWNLAAAGDVSVSGAYTPTVRWQSTATSSPTVLPSNGPERTSTGITSMRFTGTTWPAHATGGIDWDLMLVPSGSVSWYIGNWGHAAHPTREMGEFSAANGQSFREQQHILRVLATGDLTTLIAPFRKGESPASRTVTQEPCGLQVVQPLQTVCVGVDGFVGSTSTTQTIGSFGGRNVSGFGVTMSGIGQVSINGTTMTISLAGSVGRRSVDLPDGWSTPSGWTRSGNTISIQFDGTAASWTAMK